MVENDPTAGLGHFGEWLTDGGLALDVVRPHAGEDLPEALADHSALVVLGGHQSAYPAPDGTPGSAWFPTLESLLRHAVRERVPTLGICLGAQLLAQAHNGTVAPAASGPEIGPALVAKRDAAESDPLFGPLPMLPDVIQWHGDEITELPLGAVLLATSTACPVQAFRLGSVAWGVQFHPEVDLPTLAGWAASTDDPLPEQAGVDRELVVDQAAHLQDDLFEVWHPFAIRFAALATGSLTPPPSVQPGRRLPLLDS
ncbi:MAG: type 1 glutamine amidotransferase [Micromonosporaceae bacterium]|nr:type 1 glutamine amidotransferase [Micromonosporaceae bacterium]